jgi:restriction endonuclease Mrr
MSSVFVWRAITSTAARSPSGRCIYCGAAIHSRWHHQVTDLQKFDFASLDTHMKEDLGDYYISESGVPLQQAMINAAEEGWIDAFPVRATCERCGWWKQGLKFRGLNANSTGFAALRNLDINDADIAISEVQAHLSSQFADIYSLSPRKFEELIAAVYSNIGWEVALTKQTRDGGVDIFCLNNSSGRKCIVECKKYARDRTVGIFALDRLLGVKIRTASDEAHLVTSRYFSTPATAAQRQAAAQGIDLKLVDAHELLHLLDVYSNHDITLPDVRRIFGIKADDA